MGEPPLPQNASRLALPPARAMLFALSSLGLLLFGSPMKRPPPDPTLRGIIAETLPTKSSLKTAKGFFSSFLPVDPIRARDHPDSRELKIGESIVTCNPVFCSGIPSHHVHPAISS
ncbi:hypothetical protein F4780DRAFT_282733 [Xylariomycetidae sp. FL0641]|nr:hypothetical protein F4780DRAFT_282733 [Xylariomycetidae sp. FL0641]